jgi:stage V sporulation protein B
MEGGARAGAMNFVRNAQTTLLTQVANAVLGLALSVVLARWLSVPDRGLYAVVMTFALLADYVVQLGMRLAVIYRIGRAGAAWPRAVGAALQISLAAFVPALALALVFGDELRERFLLEAGPAFLWIALALTALEVFGGLFESVARAIDRFTLRNAYQIGVVVVSLVAASVALVGFSSGVLAALAAVTGARALLALVFAGAVLRHTGADLRAHPDELRAALSFGVRGWLQMLLGKLHERVDVMLLALLHGDAAQIALYAVAVSVIDRLRMVPDAIGSALLPKLAVLEPGEAPAFTARVTRHAVFWVCVSALGLALVGPPLIPLVFGEPYSASLPPFYVLLPATVMLTIRRVVANYFTASGRPGFNAGVQALAFALNVSVNLVAIPRYGILGAALASLVSYGFEAIATVWTFRRETGERVTGMILVRRGDLAPYLASAQRYLRGTEASRDS